METAQKIILSIFLLKGVWCEDQWSISLPEEIEALSGSCVTINCRFTINNTYNSDLTDSAAGVWYKDKHETRDYIAFNSSMPSNKFKGNITGKLKDKNCTTIFYDVSSNHSGRFYFRIEGNGALKYTYTEKPVSIHVIESPPKPTVKMFKEQMEVQDQEEVLEGSSVSLYCSAKTLCSSSPPTLTWSSTDRLPPTVSSRLQEQQNHTEIISDLNFTVTHLQHGVTFTCTLTYQLQHEISTAQSNITLHVQYAPKNTSVCVFPSDSVLEGRSVTLTCSSDANPAVLNYTWYRENEGQLQQLQTGHNLTFNVTDRTHTGRYYCQATNQHGTQNTSVLLDIQYAPKISLSSCNRTDVTVCSCEVDGNPSPKVEWHLSGRAVTNSTNTSISEERLSSTGLRSFITLHQSLKHTHTLQCVSTNNHGTASHQFQLVPCPKKTTGFVLLFVLIVAVVGASVIMILFGILLMCKRGGNGNPSQSREESTTRSISTNEENEEESFSANQSPAGAASLNQPESLIYASIDHTNTKTEPGNIRRASSLNTEYADVRQYSKSVAESATVAQKRLHTGLTLSFNSGVWCSNWNISLPEKIEALNGSCVTINCRFTIDNTYNSDLTDSTGGVWYKDRHDNSEYVVFNSRNSSNKLKGNITGKLKDKNCTTIFYDVSSNHNGTFYFRIEGNGGLKYTFEMKHVSMHVIDSPPKPTVKMFKEQMEVQDQEEVLEGSSVSLYCSAKTLCSSSPPTLTWSSTDRLPLSGSSRLQEQQNQTDIISDLNFTATRLQHGVTFTCTITYQLQHKNSTAQSNITLRVQYAPKFSLFSCNRTDVTVCSCEVDGNPSPKVEWHLSGRAVTNTSISEEQLNSTGLRSFITLHQSLTHTHTLQCVSTNNHGNTSHQFQLVPSPQETTGLNLLVVLIVAVVGASVMMVLFGILLMCKRGGNGNPSQSRGEGTTRSISTNEENEEESVYANQVMQSPAGAAALNQPESLIYASIDRRVSSLTTDQAVVRQYSESVAESATVAQVIVSEDVVTKQIELNNSDEEMLADSASQLYAHVKHRNR